MPGPYGRIFHIIGDRVTNLPKQVRSGACVVCGKEVYREVYTVDKGWFWRHYGCDPVKVVVERRYARSDKGADYRPMAYVPSNFIQELPDRSRTEWKPKRSA